MADNYFDPEAETSPAGPQDTQSSDQSKSGLRKAWEAWSDRPENNAALLQFGIAMMQPRAPGQSALGAAANAIGEGAQASDRNIAAQRADTAAQRAEIDAAANRDVKNREAGSREVSAKAYADQVAQGEKKAGSGGMQGRIATQRAFNQWLKAPSDATNLTVDPIVQALQKQFPDIKSKGDLLSNPQALVAARRLFETNIAEPDEDTGAPTAPTPSATPPVTTQAAPIRRYNAQGKGVEWNGTAWVPIN